MACGGATRVLIWSMAPHVCCAPKHQLLLVHSLSILWSYDPWYCCGLFPTAHLTMILSGEPTPNNKNKENNNRKNPLAPRR